MALKRCGDCKNPISKKAEACPYCGRKIRRTSGCLKLVLLAVLVIGVISIVTAPRTESERTPIQGENREIEEEAKGRVERSFQIKFQIKAEKAVRRLFKDPDSVKFRGVSYGQSDETGEVIFGEVNAKNGLGAYNGFERFISSGKTTLLESKEPRFKEAWLSIQQPRITRETLDKLPRKIGAVLQKIDLPGVIGKTQPEVARILGEASGSESTKHGPKKIYKNGAIEIVFIAGKADWITISDLQDIPFSPSCLEAFGLKKSKPSHASAIVIRWTEIKGMKSLTVFKGKDEKCEYAYCQALTE
ncbi:hypothetical protein N9067_04175 [Akkermansiaceae bacterium]|nr:hypothetical protein [Akkermansiaceae bacterium]